MPGDFVASAQVVSKEPSARARLAQAGADQQAHVLLGREGRPRPVGFGPPAQREEIRADHVGNAAWLAARFGTRVAMTHAEFGFDFDPCPYPLPDGFDGLTCEWGKSNYVNPPFGSIIHQGKKKGPTAWVRKAIAEFQKGKRVVLVYPVDKWVLMMLGAIGTQVRNLGDVRWHAIEDGSQGKGTGRHIACFVLDPR